MGTSVGTSYRISHFEMYSNADIKTRLYTALCQVEAKKKKKKMRGLFLPTLSNLFDELDFCAAI